jgi:plastocyanin
VSVLVHLRFSPAWLAAGLMIFLSTATWADEPVPTFSPSNTDPEETILVKIRARSFEPSRVVLHAGRKTRLTFQNLDAELHAFVPVGLFTGVNLNLSGNGAPEFGAEGFKRVIIPSDGLAEFRFVPERPGTFPYFCDMPGHDMRATIIVE